MKWNLQMDRHDKMSARSARMTFGAARIVISMIQNLIMNAVKIRQIP
jgi:hypothetical protein